MKRQPSADAQLAALDWWRGVGLLEPVYEAPGRAAALSSAQLCDAMVEWFALQAPSEDEQ